MRSIAAVEAVVEHLVDAVRDALELGDELARGARRGSVPRSSASRSASRYIAGDLGDERLGGGDADLEAGAREQDAVGVARGLRAHDVRDRQHRRAALAGQAHRGERVGGLARLGDADDEVAAGRRPGCGSGTRRRCPSRPARAPTPRSRSGRSGRRGSEVPQATMTIRLHVAQQLVVDRAEVAEVDAVAARRCGRRSSRPRRRPARGSP